MRSGLFAFSRPRLFPKARPSGAGLLLFWLALAGSLAQPARLAAQPEIVPADHPLYGFLHTARTAGLLPEYRHEVRPLGRDQLQVLLDSLETRSERLDGRARTWLSRYRQELFEPADRIERVVQPAGLRIPRGRDTEKVFYHYQSEDWRFALHLGAGLHVRRVKDSLNLHGLTLEPALRVEGNYRNRIGFYSRTFNGRLVQGDSRVLAADPDLAGLYYIGREAVPPGTYDQSAASVRVGGRRFFGELAHGRLLVGAGFTNGLILSGAADHFSFLRLGVETRLVQYQFVHGALGDRARYVFPDERPVDPIIVGPERYLALHRLAFFPSPRLALAFTEMVVYGLRGPELAYLNPVNPFKTAEHALWDRDNTLFTLEGVLRVFRGAEAHLTWLVDDLSLKQIGRGSYNNKWGLQAGLGVAPRAGLLVWAEYTRLEPFVYTHRFERDGSFYNSYLHNGFALGHPLGPNADRWATGLAVWLPGRVRVEGAGFFTRRGENYTGPDGRLINVGGDLLDGRSPGFDELTKQFLAGALYEGPGVSLALEWEPVREVYFELHTAYQAWRTVRALGSPAPDRFFARAAVRIDW